MRDDNYDDPASRRLALTLKPRNLKSVLARLAACGAEQPPAALRGGEVHASCALTATAKDAPTSTAAAAGIPPTASLWRNATDVLLKSSSGVAVVAQDAALTQLAQLPFVQLLNLRGIQPTEAAAHAAFSGMAERLTGLILSDCEPTLPSHVPLLSQLRVLVLDRPPTPQSLVTLLQLQYLHFSTGSEASLSLELGHVLRWLSSVHALRSLSVHRLGGDGVEPLLRPAMASVDEQTELSLQTEVLQDDAAAHLPPVDWNQPCGLTDLSVEQPMDRTTFPLVCKLPSLTRLQASNSLEAMAYPDESHLGNLCLPPLQQLRLSLSGRYSLYHNTLIKLEHVARVPHLRVLQLSATDAVARSVGDMLAALSGSSATLEKVRFDESIKLIRSKRYVCSGRVYRCIDPPAWPSLARCVCLRVLHLAVTPDEDVLEGLPGVLASLPSFRSLELVCRSAASMMRLPNLLRSMARSRSWTSLHLHGPLTDSASAALNERMPPMGADEATRRRVRVCVHSKRAEQVYAIQAAEEGQLLWQLE